jgi:cysteine-rich repeat protein
MHVGRLLWVPWVALAAFWSAVCGGDSHPGAGTCGDGIVQAGEECDDGDATDDDACTDSCTAARCGDGIVQASEECDDGNATNDDACTDSCTAATCGDGYVWAGTEACEDGNGVNTDDCVACQPARCGDGFSWAGHESCDDGNGVDDDLCRNDCTRRCDVADFPGAVGAGLFDGSCYVAFDQDPDIGCAEAETACTALAGVGAAHLASIGSAAENDFVRDLGTAAGVSVTWIGLDDLAVEGIYAWTDATAVAYTAWAASEPTDADADPDDPNDCVSLDTALASPDYGLWNDRPPLDALPYACEYVWPGS